MISNMTLEEMVAAVDPGWKSIASTVWHQISALSGNFNISYVGEGNGKLAVYFYMDSGGSDADFIAAGKIKTEAEKQSMHTCQVCGQPGKFMKLSDRNRTLCGRHEEIWRYQNG